MTSFFNLKTLKDSFKLAWPISLQNALGALLGMIDVMMVSHIGNASVAAVGFGNRVQFVVLIIMAGLATGVGILSAQNYGAGKSEKIRSSILMGIILGGIALLPIIILTFYFADSLIALGSNDSNVIAIGEGYLWITMPSMLFLVAIMTFESALRSISQVKLPLFFSGGAIVLNIILNYWFIYGGLGLEAMGVNGAAWATTISRGLHIALMFGVLTYTKHAIKPSRHDVKELTSKAPWLHLIKLVTPMMFGFGVWSLGTFAYQLIYGRIGTQELAVISLLGPIEGMFISIFFGFASACAIMVGQNLGANKFEQAITVAKSFVVLAPISAIALGCLLLMAEPLVFLPFSDMPQATLEMASQVFMVIALGAWLKISNMTIAMGVLRAGGETKACLYIDTFGMWVVSIPLTWMAAFYWHLPMYLVVLTALSEELTKLSFFVWRSMQKKWLRNIT